MYGNDPRWHRKAACRDRADLDWHCTDADELAACRVVCADCEVRTPCLALALENDDPWGMWGGLSPDDRERMMGCDSVRILPAHGTNSRYSKHRCRCSLCRTAHSTYERIRRRRPRIP